MTRRARTLRGFTLVELMIVVAILGILASIAIPTFTMLIRRSKSAEVASNLNMMFKNAAAYYDTARADRDLTSSTSGYCTVSSVEYAPEVPNAHKQAFRSDDPSFANFRAIGFTIADFVYYGYGMHSGNGGNGKCGNTKGNADLYTFYARGDLDEDNEMSTFELAAGSDQDNTLYHSIGMYVHDEME